MLAKYDCAKHKFPLIENVHSLQKTNKAINKRFLKNAGRVQKSQNTKHDYEFLRKTRVWENLIQDSNFEYIIDLRVIHKCTDRFYLLP